MPELETVPMYRDEIEALKLCDLDGLTQEQAGRKMGVSRGTVQRILASARRKTAEALSGCKAIVLEDVLCGRDDLTFPQEVRDRQRPKAVGRGRKGKE